MSNYFLHDQFIDIGSLTDGGTLVWQSPQVVDVKRIILITTTAYTVANDTVTISVRDNDDSPTETKGSFPMAFTGSAIGDVTKVDLIGLTAQTTGIDGSLVNFAADGFIEVGPGQELVIVSAGTQTAGAAFVWIEFEKQGFSGRRAAGTSTNVVKNAVYTAV